MPPNLVDHLMLLDILRSVTLSRGILSILGAKAGA